MAMPARIASFFKTKRPGMLVGGVQDENLEILIKVIKEAKAEGQGIVFFLFSNPGGKGPAAGMTVAVSKPREDKKPIGRKPQASDPLAGLFGEEETDTKEDGLGW